MPVELLIALLVLVPRRDVSPEVRPKGRKHDETGARIASTPVSPAFYPANPCHRRLTSLQPEIPQQAPGS